MTKGPGRREPTPDRYETLLDVVPDAMVIVAAEGTIVRANEQAEAIFGYEAGGLEGVAVEELIPDEAHRRHLADRVACTAEPPVRPTGEQLELRGRRRDGSELPVEVSLSPLPGNQGMVAASIRDVSERIETVERMQRSEARLEEAQTVAHLGSWEWDIAADEITWTDELYRIYGLDPEGFKASYDAFLERVHRDDRDYVDGVVRGALETGSNFEFDHRIVRPSGEVRTVHGRGRVISDESGRPVRMIGTGQDVSDLRDAEAEAVRASTQNQAILNAAGEGIIGLDSAGRIQFVNPAAAQLTGWSRAELIGRSWQQAIYAAEPSTASGELTSPLRTAIERGYRSSGDEELFRRRDGTVFPVEYVTAPMSGGDGTVLTFSDVTDRKRSEAQLQFLADHDALTGLFNRRRFDEELARQVAYAERHGGSGSVLLLDIDNFKDTNDTLGHGAGDELLVAVARVLRARLRETDILARLGGDEFAALLPETDVHGAEFAAGELLAALRANPFGLAGHRTRVTASAGVASFGGERDARPTAAELLVEADVAMYEAKEKGRDRARAYSGDARREAVERRVAMIDRVRDALEDGGFVLWAQPIIEVESGRVTQYEVLLRMRGDGEELIPPGAFIPTAERVGLIGAVDSWVVRNAIRTYAALDPAQRPEALAINISGLSIGDADLQATVERELGSCGLDPSFLVLEITETATISRVDEVRAFVDRLHMLGCRVALDDFGAGFGSFYYLKHLPVDFLKIDGEFIAKLPRSPEDQLVVRSIAEIARGLGRLTIAEFVESEQTVELLADYGVDYAQGFHTGRPAPLTEIFRIDSAASSE